jgi:hypothetical protein
MKGVLLIKRIKVSPVKHIMFGKTEQGYLFVSRHLVPAKKQMGGGWKCIYKRKKVKICDTVIHVTDETFQIMMMLYFTKDTNKIAKEFVVELGY